MKRQVKKKLILYGFKSFYIAKSGACMGAVMLMWLWDLLKQEIFI